jgi:ribosomal protein RSM22 (predicted rRNA methylase)
MAHDLPTHYRAGGNTSGVIDSDEAVAAYALARLPATFAAVSAALDALAEARPDFAPREALDIGCGPGSALIAALDAFPALAEVTGFDKNLPFLAFANRLVREVAGAGREATFIPCDLSDSVPGALSDLVLCSYALVELEDHVFPRVVRAAWNMTRQALVLVEPGSRAGFARIQAARQALIAEGATIVAPCTHPHACPMAEPDWCHFAVRLQRSRAHRLVKGGDAPFEDEKFSYLVAVRGGGSPTGRRILAPARHGKAGHQFRVCGAEGLAEVTIRPRDPAFKAAKKRDWGDLV